MDDSFSNWRGADNSITKTTNRQSSLVISDSENGSDLSIASNDRRKVVIESSDSEDDTNDISNSRMSSESGGNHQRLRVRSTSNSDNRSKSSDSDNANSDADGDLDDSSSSLDVPIPVKKHVRKRIILDDSEEDVTNQIDEQVDKSWNSSKSADTDYISENTDHSHDEDIGTGLNATSDLRNSSNANTADTLIARKEIRAGRSEERNKSCLTISDSSDIDEISNHTARDRYVDLASGLGASNSLSPGSNTENDAVVMSLVKKEVGVGNVDPFIEQKRAILSCNIQQVRSRLAKSKMLLNTANIALLPDKGEKLRRSINAQEVELQQLSEQLESLPKLSTPKRQTKAEEDIDPVPLPPWKGLPVPKEVKTLGQKALATQEREQALTEERLKDLHGSLNARPGEDERAQDPRGLKVSLMPHQQHALAWLQWREKQSPRGGILADDMGLGKTLTMIALIISTIENKDSDNESGDSDEEWVHRKKSIRPRGGTLVVCPASVLSQWEGEVNKRTRRGMLSVELFHGHQRETVARRLAKNDIVITTYNLISREYNKGNPNSVLFDINWKRVILDEAHIVRNHKSQASEAVCSIHARARWALTGTPIQNKELDLYALLKFLKCSPFDDIRVWKRWVDNKNAHGHERLATVMKTLMLRRTKLELQAKGGLGSLPDKSLEEINIKLDSEEQLVYEKVLVFSRTLFAQFLHQRAEKNHTVELNAGKFDAPTFLQKPKDTQFNKVQNQLLARHADVKAHEILVLLLRLRQICCHPALINAMLDQEDLQGNEIVDEGNINPDLLSGLGALKLEENENIDPNEMGVDSRVVENLLTSKNPVFNPKRQSSKMRAVVNTIQEILNKGDKIVVVSQWTSMLEVVASHLDSLNGATYDILSGKVPVKNRQHIVESFNKVGSAPQILLLSLTAGGVGLNLVGGNHLLLLDIHWNPQLEAQAQDRIFRVGQTKSVYIYKFMCLDTVEQRIKALQEKKLSIAQGVLTGAGTAAAAKLTLDDLKSLFSL